MAEKLTNFKQALTFVEWAKNQESILFILDASNIIHKSSKKISIKRLLALIDYLHSIKNAIVIAILSAYKAKELGEEESIESLKSQDLLFIAPSKQHDDWLMLELARKKNGIIISNDRFREYANYYPDIIYSRLLSYFIVDFKDTENFVLIPEVELYLNDLTKYEIVSTLTIQ